MTLTINLSITPGAACSVNPDHQPSSLPATPGAACSVSHGPQPSSNPTTHDAPSFVIRHPFWPDLREKYLHTTDAELAQLIAKEPDRLYEYTAACFCLTEDCNKELLQFKDMYVEIFHIIKEYARMFTFWWIDLEKEEKHPEFLEALAHLSQQLLDDLKDHRIPEEYPYH